MTIQLHEAFDCLVVTDSLFVVYFNCLLSPVSQPSFSVVDPMCGMGTILIEAAQEHKVGAQICAMSAGFKNKTGYNL